MKNLLELYTQSLFEWLTPAPGINLSGYWLVACVLLFLSFFNGYKNKLFYKGWKLKLTVKARDYSRIALIFVALAPFLGIFSALFVYSGSNGDILREVLGFYGQVFLAKGGWLIVAPVAGIVVSALISLISQNLFANELSYVEPSKTTPIRKKTSTVKKAPKATPFNIGGAKGSASIIAHQWQKKNWFLWGHPQATLPFMLEKCMQSISKDQTVLIFDGQNNEALFENAKQQCAIQNRQLVLIDLDSEAPQYSPLFGGNLKDRKSRFSFAFDLTGSTEPVVVDERKRLNKLFDYWNGRFESLAPLLDAFKAFTSFSHTKEKLHEFLSLPSIHPQNPNHFLLEDAFENNLVVYVRYNIKHALQCKVSAMMLMETFQEATRLYNEGRRDHHAAIFHNHLMQPMANWLVRSIPNLTSYHANFIGCCQGLTHLNAKMAKSYDEAHLQTMILDDHSESIFCYHPDQKFSDYLTTNMQSPIALTDKRIGQKAIWIQTNQPAKVLEPASIPKISSQQSAMTTPETLNFAAAINRAQAPAAVHIVSPGQLANEELLGPAPSQPFDATPAKKSGAKQAVENKKTTDQNQSDHQKSKQTTEGNKPSANASKAKKTKIKKPAPELEPEPSFDVSDLFSVNKESEAKKPSKKAAPKIAKDSAPNNSTSNKSKAVPKSDKHKNNSASSAEKSTDHSKQKNTGPKLEKKAEQQPAQTQKPNSGQQPPKLSFDINEIMKDNPSTKSEAKNPKAVKEKIKKAEPAEKPKNNSSKEQKPEKIDKPTRTSEKVEPKKPNPKKKQNPTTKPKPEAAKSTHDAPPVLTFDINEIL